MAMAQRSTGKGEDSERVEYWRGMIERWRSSGQTQEAFCRQRHLKIGTFVSWKHRWAGRRIRGGNGSSASSRAGFVEISLKGAEGAGEESWGYEVELANGRRVRLGREFDEGTLSRLISALEGSC